VHDFRKKLSAVSQTTTTRYDPERGVIRETSVTRHSPQVDEIQAAQRAWSGMSPSERREELVELPVSGALVGGFTGGLGGLGLADYAMRGRRPGLAVGAGLVGAALGAYGGYRAGSAARENRIREPLAPSRITEDLANQQFRHEALAAAEKALSAKTSALDPLVISAFSAEISRGGGG
jgi:hypothetical protein